MILTVATPTLTSAFALNTEATRQNTMKFILPHEIENKIIVNEVDGDKDKTDKKGEDYSWCAMVLGIRKQEKSPLPLHCYIHKHNLRAIFSRYLDGRREGMYKACKHIPGEREDRGSNLLSLSEPYSYCC